MRVTRRERQSRTITIGLDRSCRRIAVAMPRTATL